MRNLSRLVEGVKLGVPVTARKGASLGDGSFAFGFLALTADELVLVQAKHGLIGAVATRVLATVPREDVHELRVGAGRAAKRPLDVVFRDGDGWKLDVARAHAAAAERLVSEFG